LAAIHDQDGKKYGKGLESGIIDKTKMNEAAVLGSFAASIIWGL